MQTITNKYDEKTFKETLTNISNWTIDWQLPISTEKSKWLLLTNKVADSYESKFELAGVMLPRVVTVLDLGINFNSRLNFSNHISIIIAQAKQRLFP